MTSESDTGSSPTEKTGESANTAPGGGKRRRNPVTIDHWRFAVYVVDRFMLDGCQQRAASLTFTSLLAMVPLLAVSFAIFAAFPAYAQLQAQVQAFLFENMVPHVGSALQEYLEDFTAQTGRLTTVGVVFLGLSAIMLMVSVSNTFNHIWRVKQTRSMVARMVTFWAVITLTPLLFGASLSISSYLFTAAETSGISSVEGTFSKIGFLLPFVLQAIGFTSVFLVMPNYPVRRSDALIGGLVASTLFELLKEGFGLYITSFPTYQTIYGAMATVPIFLVWVYLVWIVVLLSAQLTAAIPEWQAGTRRVRRRDLAPLERMLGALSILSALRQNMVNGGGLSNRRLLRETGLGPDSLSEVSDHLIKQKYVTRGAKGEWLLCRDLTTITIYDLYSDLELGLEQRMRASHMQRAWARRFAAIRKDLNGVSREALSMTLEEILRLDASGELHPVDNDNEEDQENTATERRHSRARILALLGIGAVSAGS